VAVGHTLLVAAFHLLRDGTTDRDLGPTYFDSISSTASTSNGGWSAGCTTSATA
jgi:hypothetical protein